MLLCTTWKSRPLSPDQTKRMMETWGKLEAVQAENSSADRLCWYLNADGSGGLTVTKVNDVEAATALGLEQALALSEFLELDTNIVVDMDTAMPPILKAMEYIA